jgi:hypothetical protein
LFLLDTVKRAYFEIIGYFFRISLLNPGFPVRETTVFAPDRHKKNPIPRLFRRADKLLSRGGARIRQTRPLPKKNDGCNYYYEDEEKASQTGVAA